MKLVLFCDYGLDDAVATVDALSHARSDGYSEVDLVAVGGNVPAERALRNAEKLLGAFFGAFSGPLPRIAVVDTCALGQPCEFLKTIHGEDGMGGLFEDIPAPVPVIPFAEWLQNVGMGFDFLSLGPMTLVPYALEKRPRRFVFMGGNVAEAPNYRGYEFNHGVNREAFAECVRAPHVAVTMDTCRHPAFNIQPCGVEGKGLLRRLVQRTREMTFQSGEKGCYVWDDIAVKYLRHPDWFATEELIDRDGNRLTVARYVLGKNFADVIDL